MLELWGSKPFWLVMARAIQAWLDGRAKTPLQAKTFLGTRKSVFRCAKTAQLIGTDPTLGFKALKPKTEGFRVWSEEEAAQCEARWPLGTRERLASDIALYTGLRRGDLARPGRQHVKDGIMSIRTGKTGQWVVLPVSPELADSIGAAPTGDLAYAAGINGRPQAKRVIRQLVSQSL